jgi:hypothetical protein
VCQARCVGRTLANSATASSLTEARLSAAHTPPEQSLRRRLLRHLPALLRQQVHQRDAQLLTWVPAGGPAPGTRKGGEAGAARRLWTRPCVWPPQPIGTPHPRPCLRALPHHPRRPRPHAAICQAGYAQDSNGACTLCPANTTSAGGDASTAVCTACPAGKVADAGRVYCYTPTCPPGTGLYGGDCQACRNDRVNAAGGDALTWPCTPCPAGTAPNANKTACEPLTVTQALARALADYRQIAAGVVGGNIPYGYMQGNGQLSLQGWRGAAAGGRGPVLTGARAPFDQQSPAAAWPPSHSPRPRPPSLPPTQAPTRSHCSRRARATCSRPRRAQMAAAASPSCLGSSGSATPRRRPPKSPETSGSGSPTSSAGPAAGRGAAAAPSCASRGRPAAGTCGLARSRPTTRPRCGCQGERGCMGPPVWRRSSFWRGGGGGAAGSRASRSRLRSRRAERATDKPPKVCARRPPPCAPVLRPPPHPFPPTPGRYRLQHRAARHTLVVLRAVQLRRARPVPRHARRQRRRRGAHRRRLYCPGRRRHGRRGGPRGAAGLHPRRRRRDPRRAGVVRPRAGLRGGSAARAQAQGPARRTPEAPGAAGCC